MDLEAARQLIEQYGYLAVFLSTVIEGEIVVLAAAALAAGGMLDAGWVMVCAALGAFVGHILLFALGRWKGMELIEAVPLLRRHYPKANLIMDRYANYSVFIFQYMYGMRLLSAMLFGCSTIAWPRFLLLEVVNCSIWAVLVYFAGHLVGTLAMQLYAATGLYGLLGMIAVIVLSMLLLYRRFGHHHVRAFLASGDDAGIEQTDAVEGRHFLLEQMNYHIALADRSGQPLSIILLHYAGGGTDDVLSGLAGTLRGFLRLSDIPARFSRDTMAVLAPGTDLVGAQRAARRLGEHIRRALRDGAADTLLIGVAGWRPGMSAGEMLDEAFASIAEESLPPVRKKLAQSA